MKRIILASAVLATLALASVGHADDGGDDKGGGNGGSASGAAAAKNAGTAVGTGTVVVFTPVTISQTQGLNFGAITSLNAGTVAIDAVSGARSVTGGVGALTTNAGQKGTFTITGQSNAAINVVVGSAISGFAGGITGVTAPSALPTVLNGATATFAVGGALSIPAKTPAGIYSGTYTVAVNYP